MSFPRSESSAGSWRALLPLTLLPLTLLLLGGGGPACAEDVVEVVIADALGNIRVITDDQGNVLERHDYLPFGEECTTGPCATNPGLEAGQARKFTGKERDTETGLDYFGARYYGSKIGRFITVDPVMSVKDALVNPQKWNRYAYSLNNPLRYVDPDGREEISVRINTFIPHAFITTPFPMKGDARGPFESGTYRTSQTVVVETDPGKSASGFVSASAATGESLGFGDQGILTRGRASAEGLNVSVSRGEGGEVNIHATGSASYPNFPSVPITYDLNLSVSDRQGQVAVGVSGTHRRFPGFEVLAQREGSQTSQGVYSRTPGRSQVAPLGITSNVGVNQPPKTLEDR